MGITSRLSIVVLSLVTGGGLLTARAQDLTVTHVAGNIHMLEGKGGNIAVSAGEDGLLIVDDQYASEEQVKAGKSMEEIQAEGVPAAYKDWAGRFISEQRWIIIVYTDLAK